MTETPESRTILVNALLAGHTLLVQREDGWIAQEIDPAGRLRPARLLAADPTAVAWRGGHSRCA